MSKKVQVEKAQASKSQRMRELYDQGKSLKEIAIELGVRYQFVYNVISRYKLEKVANGK